LRRRKVLAVSLSNTLYSLDSKKGKNIERKRVGERKKRSTTQGESVNQAKRGGGSGKARGRGKSVTSSIS